MLGGHRTYEVIFENCELPEAQVLGKIGDGFGPMQLRLTVRRLEMGATCVGIARRSLDMMLAHVKDRITFGEKLADRQAIQWWIADAATKIHATRLMVHDAARKVDAGDDVRTEASMIKVFATEMATEIVDHAMQHIQHAFTAFCTTSQSRTHLRRANRGSQVGDCSPPS